MSELLQDPLLALFQPGPVPQNLVQIPGPVYVESAQLQSAFLSVPVVGFSTAIDGVVKSDPYHPYAAKIQSVQAVQSIPVVQQIPVQQVPVQQFPLQTQKRLLLLDEDVRTNYFG